MNEPKIVHVKQLPRSIAEPVIQKIQHELIAEGWMRTAANNWDHQALAITVRRRCIGAITFEEVKWQSAISTGVGGILKPHRGQGYYRLLWDALVAHVREHFPEARVIASGYHIANLASAAMHQAFGRTAVHVQTEYRLD